MSVYIRQVKQGALTCLPVWATKAEKKQKSLYVSKSDGHKKRTNLALFFGVYYVSILYTIILFVLFSVFPQY